MKYLLIVLLIALNLNALQESWDAPSANHDDYWYVSGGFAVIAPKVSLGYRFQRGKFGGDISITEAAIPPVFFSQGIQFNQLHYPRPNLDGQWYIGIGEGIHYVIGDYPVGGFLDISIAAVGGYQFKPNQRRHFIEGKIGVPLTASVNGAKFPIPVPSISYGVSF